MPIYEFRCDRCRLRREVTRSISLRDEPLACPECGGATVRVPTAAGTVIPLDRAGKGFAATEHPDVDRVVGTDTEHRLESMRERHVAQVDVIRRGATNVARANLPDGRVTYTDVSRERAIDHARAEQRLGKIAPPAPLPATPEGGVG